MEKEENYIDMSGRIYKMETIGIASLGINTKKHNGCALKGNLIKFIEKNLCVGSIYEEHAKLYAICIYLLIRNKLHEISSLTICNDEDFYYVKKYLLCLLEQMPSFEIISITEFRNRLGRKINSPADNYAKNYRKRGLNKIKWKHGKILDVVEIKYELIKEYWNKLKEID
jgi:hypothetical protein